jgi:hypothetical protein
VYSHIYFYNETNFIGQRVISPTVQIIESMTIVEEEAYQQTKSMLFKRKSTAYLQKET